jgi:hypothetical protein
MDSLRSFNIQRPRYGPREQGWVVLEDPVQRLMLR